MSKNIAVMANFANQDRFVSLQIYIQGGNIADIEQIIGTHISVLNGAILWHREGLAPANIITGCPEDPEFGVFPESAELVFEDSDSYFAACVSQQEWLSDIAEGTILPLVWWSATENAFGPDGERIAFGPTITSH